MPQLQHVGTVLRMIKDLLSRCEIQREVSFGTVSAVSCAQEFPEIRKPPNGRVPVMAATKHQAPVEEAKLRNPSRPCYLHLSAHKLRELVKSKKPLNPEHLAALDEAWFHTFGVLLVLQDCESVEARATMLGVEQVLRMCNLSLTSLKRRVLEGTFPKPHRSSQDQIGWRPRDVTAWLYERDYRRCPARPKTSDASGKGVGLSRRPPLTAPGTGFEVVLQAGRGATVS